MFKVRFLLRTAEARAALSFVFTGTLGLGLFSFGFGGFFPACLFVFFYSLGFGLLVRGGFGVRFGFGFGSGGFFFALRVAVFGCIPGVEDLSSKLGLYLVFVGVSLSGKLLVVR